MGPQQIRKTAFSGLIWQFANRIGANGVQFLIFLILARLLQPKDFGIIAIVGVFINFSNILVNSGLGSALIQSKKIDETDLSSVFYTSLIMGIILYVIIYLIAPYIADYYHQPAIVGVLRVYAISILFFAINGVQRSILLRELKFKTISIAGIISVILSGIISIVMAVLDFGIYALVANSIALGLFSSVIFGVVLKWIPKRVFSTNRIKKLFSFGYRLTLASFIEDGYKSIYPLVIGKVFGSTSLGYYNYGRQVPNLVTSTINASVASVVFPLYSRNQDDRTKLKKMVRHTIMLDNFVIFPIMVGLAAVAEPLVNLVLTEKWLPIVPYLQLFCIVYGLYHIQSVNFQAIAAIGKSNIFLKYEIIKKIIGLILLIVTVPFGIKVIIYGQVVVAVASIVLNFKPNIVWLDYSIKEQLNDIWPYLLASGIMFVGIQAISLLELELIMKLFIEIIVGFSIYIIMALVLKLKGFKTFMDILKMYFNVSKPISHDGV